MTKRACLALFPLAVLLCAHAASAAAEAGPFHDLSRDDLPSRNGVWEAPLPRHFRALSVDVDALGSLLARAPVERSAEVAEAPLVLALPYPDGTDKLFRVEESPILEPALAAAFPEIRTFVGQGIDDPTATARLSLTSLGFHAQVLSTSGTVLIDPYRRWDAQYVLSYFKREARKPAGSAFQCEVHGRAQERASAPRAAAEAASGTQLRTYRLALAGTGEYSAAVCAPNPVGVACSLNAMAVSMNRVNGIYEREVAVRMVMVANNNLIVYTSPTDPYSNGNGGAMLTQNQTNLDNVIGPDNYDIGHVFSTGGGGVAFLGVPCTGDKAGGVTGQSNPVGDGFDVDYVAHEMGHQFGADHTFNGTTSSCGGGNRNAATAYEPGSGSTIMAYAGICGAENLQPNSDDTFHGKSFDEIVTYTTLSDGNDCPVTASTGNAAPTVNAGAAFTIPKQTPFTLTGSATDPNGDALTYMWEEFDLGSAAPPNTDVAAARPIFRSFVPLTIPSRTFPRLSDILNNVATLGESMSTRNRTMTFRLTARDNRTGGGGVNYASTTVTVNATAGPFAVTAPNTAVSWTGFNVETVTWNVAGTNSAPVSCANVAIHLSTDGGSTFGQVLAASTANDGSESVVVPNTATTQARIRVSCVGNVFFDISNANFTILGGVLPTPLDFYSLTPCRLVDTRNAIGPTGGPALVGGTVRNFPIAGACGVPADAKAVVVNATVVQPTSSGGLRLFPGGITPPLGAAISFSTGQILSNNLVVGLTGTPSGSIDVQTELVLPGTTHFALDVTGYFQ